MTLVMKNQTILAKLQTTRGTAEALTDADAVEVFDVQSDPSHALRMIDRDNVVGGFGMRSPVFGGKLMSVTMSWRVLPGVANHHLALYKGCGLVETSNSDADTLELYPSKTSAQFLTIAHSYDGKKRLLHDAVANSFSMNYEAGGAIICTATFVGYGVESDEALTLPSYPNTQPFVAKGAPLTFAGISTLVHKSTGVDFGISAPERNDIAQNSGFASPAIHDINPTGNIVVGEVLESVLDLDALVSGDATQTFTQTFTRGSNTFEIHASKVAVNGRSVGDDGGEITNDLSVVFARADNGGISFNLKWE